MEFSTLVILIVLLAAPNAFGSPFQSKMEIKQTSTNTTGDSGTFRTLITVYGLPVAADSIFVKLYSRDDSVSKTFTRGNVDYIEYAFSAGVATKFWIDCIKITGSSTSVILSKPVFGDGVPSKSGTWWVMDSEAKRSNEDSDECTPSSSTCSQHTSYWRVL